VIVCLCHGVSERALEALVAAGASRVTDVTLACRAGDDCGACRAQIAWMLAGSRRGCDDGAGRDILTTMGDHA